MKHAKAISTSVGGSIARRTYISTLGAPRCIIADCLFETRSERPTKGGGGGRGRKEKERERNLDRYARHAVRLFRDPLSVARSARIYPTLCLRGQASATIARVLGISYNGRNWYARSCRGDYVFPMRNRAVRALTPDVRVRLRRVARRGTGFKHLSRRLLDNFALPTNSRYTRNTISYYEPTTRLLRRVVYLKAATRAEMTGFVLVKSRLANSGEKDIAGLWKIWDTKFC